MLDVCKYLPIIYLVWGRWWTFASLDMAHRYIPIEILKMYKVPIHKVMASWEMKCNKEMSPLWCLSLFCRDVQCTLVKSTALFHVHQINQEGRVTGTCSRKSTLLLHPMSSLEIGWNFCIYCSWHGIAASPLLPCLFHPFFLEVSSAHIE